VGTEGTLKSDMIGPNISNSVTPVHFTLLLTYANKPALKPVPSVPSRLEAGFLPSPICPRPVPDFPNPSRMAVLR
jgi:hypothetical protein